ncbi:MAG: hypothetical protein ACI9BD_001015, partial [Candidatus Marinamargulisbacteria bacterium]
MSGIFSSCFPCWPCCPGSSDTSKTNTAKKVRQRQVAPSTRGPDSDELIPGPPRGGRSRIAFATNDGPVIMHPLQPITVTALIPKHQLLGISADERATLNLAERTILETLPNKANLDRLRRIGDPKVLFSPGKENAQLSVKEIASILLSAKRNVQAAPRIDAAFKTLSKIKEKFGIDVTGKLHKMCNDKIPGMLKKMADDGLSYHRIKHFNDLAEAISKLPLDQTIKDLVITMAFYHDIVQDQGPGPNETDSLQVMMTDFAKAFSDIKQFFTVPEPRDHKGMHLDDAVKPSLISVDEWKTMMMGIEDMGHAVLVDGTEVLG